MHINIGLKKMFTAMMVIHFFSIYALFHQIGIQFYRPKYEGDRWKPISFIIMSVVSSILTIYLMRFDFPLLKYTLLLVIISLISGVGFLNIIIWITSFFKRK